MFRIPNTHEELTADWFATALGGVFQSVGIERIGEGYGLGSELFRCRLRGAGAQESVVVKLWNTDGQAGTREVDFYRTFGARAGIRLPVCYHAAADPVTKRGILVLEDLAPVIQGDCLQPFSRTQALALAETLARFHATWWGRPELDTAEWLPSVARYGREAEWFESRRALFNRRYGHRLDDFSRGLLENIEILQMRADERLAISEMTLVHGDLHLDNVLFEADTGRPILLDWPQVANGPAALNVADLIFGIAPPAERDILLAVYLTELRNTGVNSDEGSFRRQLGGALLRKFSVGTCGIARWDPASEREARLIDAGLQRICEAVAAWRLQDPDLFQF